MPLLRPTCFFTNRYNSIDAVWLILTAVPPFLRLWSLSRSLQQFKKSIITGTSSIDNSSTAIARLKPENSARIARKLAHSFCETQRHRRKLLYHPALWLVLASHPAGLSQWLVTYHGSKNICCFLSPLSAFATPLVPPVKSNPYGLRSRDHNFQLPVCNNFSRKSFIISSLFRFKQIFYCLCMFSWLPVFIFCVCSSVYFTFSTIAMPLLLSHNLHVRFLLVVQ